MIHDQAHTATLQPDVAVLLIFFNRPDTFRAVFHEVRKARPARLFLYQDGARNEQDLPGIQACRQIAEQIDWPCEVQRKYQTENYGCDPSGYMAHTWAFSLAEKCIVLEDDVVPSQSFFTFCSEMLQRYEHDERIGMVAGFNVDEQTDDCTDSYFFSSAFSIWGWASWRRVVSRWDKDYLFLERPADVEKIQDMCRKHEVKPDFLQMCRAHKASGKAHFETIFWSHLILTESLSVFPRKNLINNIGVSDNSTHFSAFRTMPRGLRRIFTMPRYELSFPLCHPDSVAEHPAYRKRYFKVQAWGHPWIKVSRSLEELFWNLRYGTFRPIFRAIAQRIRKTLR